MMALDIEAQNYSDRTRGMRQTALSGDHGSESHVSSVVYMPKGQAESSTPLYKVIVWLIFTKVINSIPGYKQ